MDTENPHPHCASCVSRRCMLRPETGVSCDLVSCLLNCGAVFHSCKADEHQILCLLERVPCLNQGFGCPFIMTRNKLAEHLQYCPANVVCCTMEWNRWPVSYSDRTSYENLSTDINQVEQLDLALALQDQRMLLESLKVATMMSKPTEKLEAQEPIPIKAKSDVKMLRNDASSDDDSYNALYQAALETTESLAVALDILNNATRDIAMLNSRLSEASFEINQNFQISAQNGTLDIFSGQGFVEEEDNGVSNAGILKKNLNQNGSSDLAKIEDADIKPSTVLCNGFHNDEGDLVTLVPGHNDGLKHIINCNSSFLGVEQPSTPSISNSSKEKIDKNGKPWFGNVAVFGRSPFLGNSYWFQSRTECKAVDTSDLEVQDDPMGLNRIDLVTAAFLFCLGESPGGRGISDRRNVDCNRVDCGTQTFSFLPAILATNTMVGDIASACACDHANPQLSNPSPFQTLGLDLVLEYVSGYKVKQRSMFTFVCGQLFRRDEFSSHFKNVHADIHAGLNGWMEQRCPLAYYGCTYSQRRFCPLTQGSKIIHDQHLKSFGVQPHMSSNKPIKKLLQSLSVDHFSSLPYEVLQHVALFLDSFTLCQLSKVSRLMRDVCASLLQARGIVVLLWEKKVYPHGSSWQIKEKVWRFSTAFSTVKEWKFADVVSMADHLKKCSYNTIEKKEKAVPLPCMCVTRELTKGGRSLRSVLKPVLSLD